jgi:hypothetical protein
VELNNPTFVRSVVMLQFWDKLMFVQELEQTLGFGGL